jgi:hypothetical protein
MLIKPGHTVLVINPPEGYLEGVGALPPGAVLATAEQAPAAQAPVNVLQLFVRNRRELEQQLPVMRSLLKPAGLLWVCYTKGTSKKYKTDIHRDSINAYAASLGWSSVMIIAIDEDWSALRLKSAT